MVVRPRRLVPDAAWARIATAQHAVRFARRITRSIAADHRRRRICGIWGGRLYLTTPARAPSIRLRLLLVEAWEIAPVASAARRERRGKVRGRCSGKVRAVAHGALVRAAAARGAVAIAATAGPRDPAAAARNRRISRSCCAAARIGFGACCRRAASAVAAGLPLLAEQRFAVQIAVREEAG